MICSRNLAGQAVALGERRQRDGPVAVVPDQVGQGAQAVFGAAGEAHGEHPRRRTPMVR